MGTAVSTNNMSAPINNFDDKNTAQSQQEDRVEQDLSGAEGISKMQVSSASSDETGAQVQQPLARENTNNNSEREPAIEETTAEVNFSPSPSPRSKREQVTFTPEASLSSGLVFNAPINPITNPDASMPVSIVDVSQLSESWSNSHQEDPMGLSSSGGFHKRSSSNTFNPPGHNRVQSIGETSQLSALLTASSSGEEASGISSVINDAARIMNWQTVQELCLTDPEAAKYVGKDKWTALHHVCSRRCPDADVVEALVRAYPDALLLEADHGWLPLHYASRFKCTKDVVRLLLDMYPEKGCTAVTRLDSKGRTPLYYAVRYDAPAGVVGLLLDVDSSAVLEEDQHADSPLALVWDVYAEKSNGRSTLQRIYISEKEAETMTIEDQAATVKKRLTLQSKVLARWANVNLFLKAAFGFSAEHDDGQTEYVVIKQEIKGRELKKEPTDRKWRILHAAAAIKCHPSLFLLAASLHPEQALEIDDDDLHGPLHLFSDYKASSRPPLHLAAASQAVGDAARLVVSKLVHLNPKAGEMKDDLGCLPLHVAATNRTKNNWETDGVLDIYTAFPRAAFIPDLSGQLPLHCAASSIIHEDGTPEEVESSSIVCQLLSCNSDAACHSDNCGRLPLHLAVEHAETWDIQMSGLHAANERAVRERTGVKLGNKLPLHMAASNAKASSSLISKIVELHPRGTSQADRQGMLPLHLACETGLSWECVRPILEAHPQAIQQVEGNDRGWTALHMAAANPSTSGELITNLVESYPAAAGIADREDRFPFHLACLSGRDWFEGLSTLFETFPDAIGMQDSSGLLPFHVAAYRYCRPENTNQRPSLMGLTDRRFSTSTVAEAVQQAKEEEEEANSAVSNLFLLLRSYPSVLRQGTY